MAASSKTETAKNESRRAIQCSWESKPNCAFACSRMEYVRATLAGRLHMYKGNKMAREMIRTSFDLSGMICTAMGDYYNKFDELDKPTRQQIAALSAAAMDKLESTTDVSFMQHTVVFAVQTMLKLIGSPPLNFEEDVLEPGTNLGQGGK